MRKRINIMNILFLVFCLLFMGISVSMLLVEGDKELLLITMLNSMTGIIITGFLGKE